jgi:hypothetical protein
MTDRERAFLNYAPKVERLAEMAWKLKRLYAQSKKDQYVDTGDVLECIEWLKDEESNRLKRLSRLASKVQEGNSMNDVEIRSKAAETDLRCVRRNGQMTICGTKLGNLDVMYDGNTYIIGNKGVELLCGKKADVKAFLAQQYVVLNENS